MSRIFQSSLLRRSYNGPIQIFGQLDPCKRSGIDVVTWLDELFVDIRQINIPGQ